MSASVICPACATNAPWPLSAHCTCIALSVRCAVLLVLDMIFKYKLQPNWITSAALTLPALAMPVNSFLLIFAIEPTFVPLVFHCQIHIKQLISFLFAPSVGELLAHLLHRSNLP